MLPNDMIKQPSLGFHIYFLLLVSVAVLTGCQAVGTFAAPLQPTPTPETILITADPLSDAQPVVFQPVEPTPTGGAIFPTATPSAQLATPTPASQAPQTPSTSGPIQGINQPDNQVNILLLGSDQRPYEGGFRTDVILLVTINTDLQTINMTSFPRDLYVTLPGFYNDRINTAQFRGGFPLTAETFAYNFGVRPDYYGLVNFYGFMELINTLGGIDVEVGQTLTDHRSGYGNYTVYPGTVHMDGDTALWYVRSRYTTSDFDRTRRQQEVVFGLIRRLISFDLVTKFPQLYEQFQGTIETNLPLEAIIPLLSVADEFFKGEIGRYAIGRGQVSNWVTPSGSQVLLPNKEAIQAILRVALNAQ
jgi:LCP family protein required for cell wall assembly